MIKKIVMLAASDALEARKKLTDSSKSLKKLQEKNSANQTRISDDIKKFKSNPKSLKNKNSHIFDI